MDEPMTYEKKDEEIDGPVIYKLLDEQGNELELEALYTFDSEETGKSYIALTDNQQDEDIPVLFTSYAASATSAK